MDIHNFETPSSLSLSLWIRRELVGELIVSKRNTSVLSGKTKQVVHTIGASSRVQGRDHTKLNHGNRQEMTWPIRGHGVRLPAAEPLARSQRMMRKVSSAHGTEISRPEHVMMARERQLHVVSGPSCTPRPGVPVRRTPPPSAGSRSSSWSLTTVEPMRRENIPRPRWCSRSF